MSCLKVNVIGVGIMGRMVLNSLLRNSQVEVSAASDLNQARLAEIKAEFNLNAVYADFHDMLAQEKPDAVFVATPDWAHFEPVMACLELGIPVNVEKPMTTSEVEAAAIVNKVRETGVPVQVAYNHRWLAPYYLTMEKVRAGEIGPCLMGYARKSNPISVPTKMLPWAGESSPMWFLSSHDIDLMTWWFDQDPVEVTGMGIKRVLSREHHKDTYDAMQGMVRYADGAFATYESTWVYPEKHPAMPDSFMEVVGEHGHIHLDRKAEAVEMSTPEGLAWPRSLLSYRVFDRWVGAFPSCINSFIDAVIEEREPFVTAYDGWRTTAVLDAIHRAVESGDKVTITPPGDLRGSTH